MKTKLTGGFLALAMRLQESAADLSASDIAKRLRDQLQDEFRDTGHWAYYIDHFGDGESGEVIYSLDGDTMRAAYSISGGEGSAARCEIDCEAAEDVVPRTIYEPEADEAEHYAAMESALKAEGLYNALPLYERFISKAERDAASADDFAGKGRSFPILKPGDIMAAVRSMGRAGTGNLGPGGIKNRIIAIAKRKGWTKYLPKAWRTDGERKESVPYGGRSRAEQSGGAQIPLTEGAATLEPLKLSEAAGRAEFPIKLIAPGKGSSAVYPAEVLKRDGPQVFKAGTHIYLNHPTAAEEAARPEGDVSNLVGVLATDAQYLESHPKGPGLYSTMKVFADHAHAIEEKAPYVGMSIRAMGTAESGKSQDGLPVLRALTSAESVDVVTRAGAGGMILTEAARAAANQQEPNAMNDTEAKALRESLAAVQADNKRLLERALRADAREEGMRILQSVSLPMASKTRVVEAVINAGIPATDGALDRAKLAEALDAEAKREGAYLASIMPAGVRGMGAGTTAAEDPAKIREAEAQREAEEKRLLETRVDVFGRLTGSKQVAEAAARKGMVA